MAYSMNSSATLERVKRSCIEATGHPQSWRFLGERYYYEEDAEEGDDGSIMGSIHRQVGEGRERQFETVGRFRIEGKDGTISEGTYGFITLG